MVSGTKSTANNACNHRFLYDLCSGMERERSHRNESSGKEDSWNYSAKVFHWLWV